CVMRTRAECRGASKTCELWMVSPWRNADSPIASAENLAPGNAAVNTDLNWDGCPERARSYVSLPIPVCVELVPNTFPSWVKRVGQSAICRTGRVSTALNGSPAHSARITGKPEVIPTNPG